MGERTSVNREVFPEPLGPMRRIVGWVLEEAERNMRRWRKSGTVSTTRMVIRIAVGVGSNREDRVGIQAMASGDSSGDFGVIVRI